MHTPTGFLVQHDSNTQNDIQDNQSGSGKKRTSWTETKTNSMDFVFVLSRTKYRNEYNLLQYLQWSNGMFHQVDHVTSGNTLSVNGHFAILVPIQ
jgi:hypothetical protein